MFANLAIATGLVSAAFYATTVAKALAPLAHLADKF